MAKKRDNFSEMTKRDLAKRVGQRCSKPGCRVPTAGPSTNPRKSITIGEAAHITAAAKGGPRYDKSMRPEDRKDIDNAIWLCSTHARLIDKDPEEYIVAKLREWKLLAEEKAKEELNAKRITDPNIDFKRVSESLAMMKIKKYLRKCNWSYPHEVRDLIIKLERFAYIHSLRLTEAVAAICIEKLTM